MAEKRGGERREEGGGEIGLLEKRKEERAGENGERVERCLECATNWRNLRVEEALGLKQFIVSGAKLGGVAGTG